MPAEYLSTLSTTLAQRESYWFGAIDRVEAHVWVAEEKTEVIGWISVGESRDDDAAGQNVGEIMAIYVLPEYWKTGVGLALWRAGVQHLTKQGYLRLTLWALTRNVRATRFYRKAGCIEETASERCIERGGVTLAEVRYILPLRQGIRGEGVSHCVLRDNEQRSPDSG